MKIHQAFLVGKLFKPTEISQISNAIDHVVRGVSIALDDSNANTIAAKNLWFGDSTDSASRATLNRKLTTLQTCFQKRAVIQISKSVRDERRSIYGKVSNISKLTGLSGTASILLGPAAFRALTTNDANITCIKGQTVEAALILTIAHELMHLICRINIEPYQEESYEEDALGVAANPGVAVNNADNYAYLIEKCCLG